MDGDVEIPGAANVAPLAYIHHTMWQAVTVTFGECVVFDVSF